MENEMLSVQGSYKRPDYVYNGRMKPITIDFM